MIVWIVANRGSRNLPKRFGVPCSLSLTSVRRRTRFVTPQRGRFEDSPPARVRTTSRLTCMMYNTSHRVGDLIPVACAISLNGEGARCSSMLVTRARQRARCLRYTMAAEPQVIGTSNGWSMASIPTDEAIQSPISVPTNTFSMAMLPKQ
jgi:hypothetical protein